MGAPGGHALPLTLCFDNLLHGLFERYGDVPFRVVGAHFVEVGDVADVIADAVFIDVMVDLRFVGEIFGEFEGFPDRAGVGASTTNVIDFTDAGCFEEFLNEAGDVVGVDVVADLFAFVAEDFVFAAFEIAFDEVREESVEFDARVVGTGEAAAAQAASGQAEVAAIFLDHDVGGDFGGTEERVFRLVDGEVLGDAVGVGGVVVVPAGFKFLESDGVGSVTIDLVGGHVDEGRFRAGLAGGFEQVQGADGVGVEIIERDGGGAVVGRLGGGVDDGIGFQVAQEIEHSLAVADIEFVVGECRAELISETGLVPACVALGAKEDSALVVVDAMDVQSERSEIDADFGANEA